MTVRLPTHESYVAAVDKEHRWLPVLASSLPVPVPVPLAKGDPGEGYPHPWSVRRWLDGETARTDRIEDLCGVASDVGEFVLSRHRIDPADGPPAGPHSFHRGGSPAYYDDETRRALAALSGRIDKGRAAAVWDAAIGACWDGSPVWFHGDLAVGNLLVRDGRLAAVIDFGTSGVGDPACDLVLAWTLFSGAGRETFRSTIDQDIAVDDATWARARGWALWKALIGLVGGDSRRAVIDHRVITEVLADA